MTTWRIIPLHTTNAYEAMGIDEAVAEAVGKGISKPTIRFWRWQPSTVSIGYFQSMEDEVDVQKCREQKVDVVRRITGGGAVYHDYEGELTYSVIAPEGILPKGITESYHEICGWIVKSLKHIGIESGFKPINDIIAGGKKISGNAQTRRFGVVLQHGTILYDLDVRKMFSLLKGGTDKISDKMMQAVEDRVTRVKNFGDITREQTYEALLKCFTDGKKFEIGKLTEHELSAAKELAKTKYSTKEWNFMR